MDFAHGILRLEPEQTKNRQAREFPLIPELRALLEAQRIRGEAITRKTGVGWLQGQAITASRLGRRGERD